MCLNHLNSKAPSGPPRPPLAFRVGVVGHRPNRLQHANMDALSKAIHDIVFTVNCAVNDFHSQHPGLHDGEPPVLRAISPLAEGSDQLFAEQALALGFALCCPMPFPQAEFEKDFKPPRALEADSFGRFHSLLQRAKSETSLTVFELDGSRLNEGAAYGAAGQIVVNQSDLLVVIWDGMRLNKIGGTEETFAEARRMGVPVIWIDAHAPHSWQHLDVTAIEPQGEEGERAVPKPGSNFEGVKKAVQELLALPEPTMDDAGTGAVRSEPQLGNRVMLASYYAERKPRLNPAVLWRWFRDLIGDGKWSFAGVRVQDFEEAVLSEWPRDESTATARVISRLRPFYAWPDKLAVCFSDAYRSAFVLAYSLAATAVGLALLPIAAGWFSSPHHGGETACIVGELFLILTILALILYGRRRHWHERWIDYRLTAELIRHLRLVVPLGGSRAVPQLPAHLATYGDPSATWAAWYVRAVERWLGLPSAFVDAKHLNDCLRDIIACLEGQVQFHQTNERRCHRIEHRLHKSGLWLLGMTILVCGVHLLPSVTTTVKLPHWLPLVLVFTSGFFPALGAAFAGINNQGEFRRISRRSKGMIKRLMRVLDSAIKMQAQLAGPLPLPGAQASAQVASIASQAAQLMVGEVLDWRVMFLDRPQPIPT